MRRSSLAVALAMIAVLVAAGTALGADPIEGSWDQAEYGAATISQTAPGVFTAVTASPSDPAVACPLPVGATLFRVTAAGDGVNYSGTATFYNVPGCDSFESEATVTLDAARTSLTMKSLIEVTYTRAPGGRATPPPAPSGGAPAFVKLTKQQLRAIAKQALVLARRATKLGPQAVKAQKAFRKAPEAKKPTFGDVLQRIKAYFDAKAKFVEEWGKVKGAKQVKELPTSVGRAASAPRVAQLNAIPNFAKALEKLGDFGNVAVRAADAKYVPGSEFQKQLDLSVNLYAAGATWTTLTPKQKRDVATQSSVMIDSGAAKRLVEEMNAAGRAGTNVVYAH
jgi:hypothetical protein